MGVVGAQVEVEGWQGRVRSVVLEPSARDLVDECKVEDMLAPLVVMVLLRFRFLRHFRNHLPTYYL